MHVVGVIVKGNVCVCIHLYACEHVDTCGFFMERKMGVYFQISTVCVFTYPVCQLVLHTPHDLSPLSFLQTPISLPNIASNMALLGPLEAVLP